MWKDLHQKHEINQFVSPFECRTAVIFQALIPTLNAFQTSVWINLWIWIGESVLQTMQCPLSHQWIESCFCNATFVDQKFHLCLQFLTDPLVNLTMEAVRGFKVEDRFSSKSVQRNLMREFKKFNGDWRCYGLSNLDLRVECDDHILPTGKSPHTLTCVLAFRFLLKINFAPHLESIVLHQIPLPHSHQ